MTLLSSNEIDRYLKNIEGKDKRKTTVFLQSLFFELEGGRQIDKYSMIRVDNILAKFIVKNSEERTRLWIYKVSCFIISPKVVKAAKRFIKYETNPENIMWIVSLVSANTYSDKEFMDFVLKYVHVLKYEHIKLACYLFGNRYKLDETALNNMGNSDDKLVITWLETIHAYSNIDKRYNGVRSIKKELIEDLTMHNDEDISKYAIGALWKHGDFTVKDIKIDYRSHDGMSYKPRKWFYTSIWQDNNFIIRNYDYINAILSKFFLFTKCDERLREGLARGLSEYRYDEQIKGRILEWYNYEYNDVVQLFLLKYMIRYENMCSEYKEIVNIELKNANREMQETIRQYKIIFMNGGRSMRIFIGSSKETVDEMERIARLIEKLGHSCILWNDTDAFVAGSNTLESIVDLAKRADAAIFVFNGEDEIWYRGDKCFSVRDNVLLEYGIFLGAKGGNKAIFICKNSPKIATDLLGVNYLDSKDGDNILKEKIKVWIDKL